MLSWLLSFVLIALIIWAFRSDNKPQEPYQVSAEDQLQNRNYEWAVFIAGYKKHAKTKAEKALVEKMLADIAARGLPVPSEEQIVAPNQVDYSTQRTVQESSSYNPVTQLASASTVDSDTLQKEASYQLQLDNASLLLYFGAFLFVASAGLFVSFGGVAGVLKTAIVLVVSLTMYIGGLWLHDTKKKLKQAGIAFAGIGLAIAPLIGLAAYTYIFDQSQGALVWFTTSVLCLCIYLHALVKFRSALLGYVFIFTILSLFQSSIAIVDAPIYYFGWGLALVGLGLTFFARKSNALNLQEPASASAGLLVPLALFTSLALVGGEGLLQFGISALLAGFFYLLEATKPEQAENEVSAMASHILFLAAIGSITFDLSSSTSTTAIVLTVVNIVQLLFIIAANNKKAVWQNFASVLIAVQFLTIFMAATRPGIFFTTALVFVVVNFVVWWRQQRTEAYSVAMVGFMLLPIVFGQAVLNGTAVTTQTWMLVGALLVQWIVGLWPGFKSWSDNWEASAGQLYAASAVVIGLVSLLSSPWVTLLICSILGLTLITYAIIKNDTQVWAGLASALVTIPLLHGFTEPNMLLTASLLALVVAILLALAFRSEFSRWWSTALWFVVPFAIGGVVDLPAASYAWLYVLVMVCLIFSRSIARGVVLASTNIPLTAYAKSASQSYVAGYSLAGAVACLIAVTSQNAQLHLTAILAVISAIVVLLASKIEKDYSLYVLLPVLMQAILLSALRPDIDVSMEVIVYLIASSGIAVLSFVLGSMHERMTALRQGGTLTAFVVPLSVFVLGKTLWPMPAGLLLASTLLYIDFRKTSQPNREWIGGLALASVWWFMYWAGVRNVQAYSHVLAALFAGYAYWRTKRSEGLVADQYLYAMLGTATVPLVLQALGGLNGGLYGWWLLLEQIGFMLLGMTIGKSFVTRWGLYVAVAAVLYQLRGLGYLALAVLAIFIIGVAIHKLQKYNDDK